AQMVYDDVFYTASTVYDRRCVSIHELGHIFGADHEDTGGFEQAYSFPGLLPHHTVMWHEFGELPGIYGMNDCEFSSNNYSGDTFHDNARRIRETRNTVSYYSDPATMYQLTTAYDLNGRIIPESTEPSSIAILAGDTFSFTIRADSDYVIDQVQVNNHPIPEATGKGAYILALHGISEEINIYATFEPKRYRIISIGGPNGKISPEGGVKIPIHTSQTFTITPDPGYVIANVQVDDESLGAITSYTFEDVTAPHVIIATFKNAPPRSDWIWARDGWGDWNHTATWDNGEAGCGQLVCEEWGPMMIDDHGEHGSHVNLNRGTTISWVERKFSNPTGIWNTLAFTGAMSGSSSPAGRWMAVDVNGNQVYHGTALQDPPGDIQQKFTAVIPFKESNHADVNISNGQYGAYGEYFFMDYYSVKLDYLDESEIAKLSTPSRQVIIPGMSENQTNTTETS
ncbi:MAG TPA: hypothetical protein VMB35_09090, partial [Methanomicrobiales archaeon]|nr:hypothetical protein [Methanomicrobiales archaeon]